MACNISTWRRVAFLPLLLALALLLSACEAAPEEAADPSFTVRVICESEDIYQIFYTFYIGDESRGMGGMADLEGNPVEEPRTPQMKFTIQLPKAVPPMSMLRRSVDLSPK